MHKGLQRGLLIGNQKGLYQGRTRGLSRGLMNSESMNSLDAFLVIGDSIGAGLVSHMASTLPPQGSAFEYDEATKVIRQFGIQSTNFNNKSPWAKFCIDYFANTSRRPLIINRSTPGAVISPATSIQVGNDWQTTGLNYYPAVRAAKECLSRIKSKKLKGILTILGINDIQGGNGTNVLTVAQVSAYLTTLIENLRRDFGTDVPIIFSIPGRFASDAVSSRISGIRNVIKLKCITFENCHIGASMQAFDIAGAYEDAIHPNVTGNDYLGAMFARWFKNARYTKWARSIISCHFDELPADKKTKWHNWMMQYQTVYLGMDMFYNTKTTLKANAGFDVTFLCSPESDDGFSFTTNSDIRTSSTSNLFAIGYNQNETAINVLTNDYGIEVKIQSVATAAGVTASVLATVTTGPTKATTLRQLNTNGINYSCLSGTSFTYLGQNALDGASWIVERTSSTNINLRKNGAVVENQTDSAVGATTGDWKLGAVRTNGTLGTPIDAKFERMILFTPSLISSYATFLSDLDTLQS